LLNRLPATGIVLQLHQLLRCRARCRPRRGGILWQRLSKASQLVRSQQPERQPRKERPSEKQLQGRGVLLPCFGARDQSPTVQQGVAFGVCSSPQKWDVDAAVGPAGSQVVLHNAAVGVGRLPWFYPWHGAARRLPVNDRQSHGMGKRRYPRFASGANRIPLSRKIALVCWDQSKKARHRFAR
jgi:hypothetical protein